MLPFCFLASNRKLWPIAIAGIALALGTFPAVHAVAQTVSAVNSVDTLKARQNRAPGPTADFFVSAFGNDAWSGTLPDPNTSQTDGPFASIARAQNAVRVLI